MKHPTSEAEKIQSAFFYKVTFSSDIHHSAAVTPLGKNQVWGEGGLDKTKPFIVINPGDTYLNVANREELFNDGNPKEVQAKTFKEGIIIPLVRIFERAAQKFNVAEERQYLVTVNAQGINNAGDLIRRHNESPDGFTTAHTQEQTRLIYGPLIAQNGVPLSDEEIVTNLSKARNYNECFGAISANGQINSLVKMMQDLGISAAVIKNGVESMRRIDAPNISATNPGISPSTVIFEGSNDQLAEKIMGTRSPSLPAGHSNIDVLPIDDHRIKIYQKLPQQVYDLSRKMSSGQEAEKSKIVAGLPKIYEKRFRNPETKEVGRFAKVAAQALAYKRQNAVLENMGLDGPRKKDPRTHTLHHYTMPATPGNEVTGRDPDLLHKLMADMLTRENPRDVMNYFRQESEKNQRDQSKIIAERLAGLEITKEK